MRHAVFAGLAIALGVAGHAAAQVQPQAQAATPAASQFTPAPVPSPAPGGTSNQPPATNAPMAAGSMRLRINGSVTSYVGGVSQH